MGDESRGSANDGRSADGQDVVTRSKTSATVDGRLELLVAAGTVALGCYLMVASRNIRQGILPDPIGSGSFALVIGLLMVVTGGIVLIQQYRIYRHLGREMPTDGEADEPGIPASAIRGLGILAAGFAWALSIERIGFILSTYLLAVIGIYAMRVRRTLQLFFVPLAYVLLIWFLFDRVFAVRFPEAGFIDGMLRAVIPRVGA